MNEAISLHDKSGNFPASLCPASCIRQRVFGMAQVAESESATRTTNTPILRSQRPYGFIDSPAAAVHWRH
jgi:hypothetical protein